MALPQQAVSRADRESVTGTVSAPLTEISLRLCRSMPERPWCITAVYADGREHRAYEPTAQSAQRKAYALVTRMLWPLESASSPCDAATPSAICPQTGARSVGGGADATRRGA